MSRGRAGALLLVVIGATACAPIAAGSRAPALPSSPLPASPTNAERTQALRALEGGCDCDARGVCTTGLSAPAFLRGQPLPLGADRPVLQELLRGAVPWLDAGGVVEALLCVGSGPTPGSGRARAEEVVAMLRSLGATRVQLNVLEGPPAERDEVRCHATRVLGVDIMRWEGDHFAPVPTREEGRRSIPSV